MNYGILNYIHYFYFLFPNNMEYMFKKNDDYKPEKIKYLGMIYHEKFEISIRPK